MKKKSTKKPAATKKHRSTTFSLKDKLFNDERIAYLAGLFDAAVTDFDSDAFQRQANAGLTKLELKERIVHIAVALEGALSDDFPIAVKQIASALPPRLDPKRSDDDFGDFIFAPLGEFVVRNGLTPKHLKRSLGLLKKITMRFSMEDAIRYFIDAYPDEVFAELAKWSTDRNYHVRRLVSEGTRPLLPWSGRLTTDALRPLPLLDQLHADSTRYVTRSVANHLNDIAKTNPKAVLKTLKGWKKLAQQDAEELAWMTRHSLRTLVKRGDENALGMLGFRSSPMIAVTGFLISSATVRPGSAIQFTFDIHAERGEALLVDYVIDFVKANGGLAPKVHKIKQLTLTPGESIRINKRHPFRANATTFTLYPGTHFLTLQINGKPYGKLPFEMLAS